MLMAMSQYTVIWMVVPSQVWVSHFNTSQNCSDDHSQPVPGSGPHNHACMAWLPCAAQLLCAACLPYVACLPCTAWLPCAA